MGTPQRCSGKSLDPREQGHGINQRKQSEMRNSNDNMTVTSRAKHSERGMIPLSLHDDPSCTAGAKDHGIWSQSGFRP